MKLSETGSPLVKSVVEHDVIVENQKWPYKIKDHPIWCHESKPWSIPPYPARGQHYSIEAHYLYRTVLELGVGNYANLGTFRGASTAYIAQGLKTINGGKVYGVDLFEGINGSHTIAMLETIFKERGLIEYVEFCQGFTHDVATSFSDTKFKYVFIDADHSYETCKQDFKLWSPLIEKGGLVLFHDVDFTGVDAVIEEILDEWELVEHVWKLKSFKRKGE